MFTQFWDMHSGGSSKEAQQFIYIEAPEAIAKVIFFNRFGHNPSRVSCTCCGEDYSISEDSSLEQLTGYHRGCMSVKVPSVGRYQEWTYIEQGDPKDSSWRPYIELADYLLQSDVLVIYEADIKADERVGEVATEGWVWQ